MHTHPAGQPPQNYLDLHSPCLVTGRCRYGQMVWPRQDQIIGRSLDLYGEFAEGENQVLCSYARPGDVVVDIGANLGTTALPLARAVGSAGQVLAFEPQPLIAQCLLANLTLNDVFHVRHFASAVGDAAGWASMQVPAVGDATNYGAACLGDGNLRVPVLRLDDLVLERCSLIKIDVEGFEWQVLQGARETIRRLTPVLYFEAKRTAGTVSCLQWLIAQGWTCCWHFAFFFRDDNFRENCQNVFPGIGDMNVLALPPGMAPAIELPVIAAPDEDWQQTYCSFFTAAGRPMPR